MRREWIEIRWSNDIINGIESPSMRREWIEMSSVCNALPFPTSPSMRREWIEIVVDFLELNVALGLPPCGGSGLKLQRRSMRTAPSWSPSMRREWIEMVFPVPLWRPIKSPSMRREWIEMKTTKAGG